eukprot:770971-Prymnesium_polylepis.1
METLEVMRKRVDRAPNGTGRVVVADAAQVQQLLAALLRVLSRRPVRRFLIYQIWRDSWIQREAAKAAGQSGGGFGPRQVAVEAAA